MKAPYAKCDECPLVEEKAVHGYGPEHAEIVVVGEAPGAQEVTTGIPFTGKSGHLFDRILEQQGIERDDVYVTNTVLCRPPENRTPTAAEIKACRARLVEEIKARQPRVVLALGNSAAKTILDTKTGITELRTTPGTKSPFLEARVVATFHPAAALRNPDLLPSIISDVGKLNRVQVAWEHTKYKVVDNIHEALRTLRAQSETSELLTLDVEVDIDDMRRFDPKNPKWLCMAISHRPGASVVYTGELMESVAFCDQLNKMFKINRWGYQNGKFDIQELWGGGMPDARVDEDTMLLHYCLVPGTRILRRDLTWAPIEKLQKSDELVAFEEARASNMVVGKVLSTRRFTAPCYAITTTKGTVVCSANHKWPVMRLGQKRTVWATPEQLLTSTSKAPVYLLHFADPWEVDSSYLGGWIAGILDGEGSWQTSQRWGITGLSFSQSPGVILDKALEYLEAQGHKTVVLSHGAVKVVRFGGNRGALRALGTFRPTRFMGRADEVWTGVRKRQPVRVLSIQYVGEQEVIGIETDTNTFVAEGFLSHNSTDERKGTHDLEQLAVEVLGAPRYKTDARSYLPHKGASLRYLPPDILYQYNAADADVTHRLVEPLWKEVNHDGVARPYRELLIPGSNALAQTEYIGVKVDRGRLDELHTSLSDELQGLEEVLHRWVGNPRSPQQVARAFGRLGVGGDEGPSTTDKEFLKRVVERHKGEAREFAKQLLEHRQRSKLLSTYVVGLGKSLVRGRIHPTFLLHGTETGRLSCRRPNLQNIPSGSTIRDAFVSGPDNVLLSADYSQIEFRLAAILSGDEWLLEQFRSGREFHKEVARKFFGETWTPLQYLRAKAVNFGTLYGRQAKSLSDEWGMPIHEAQRLINDFFGAMPRVKEWQKNTEREIREQGYLESYFGRKRRFWLVTRENWHEVIKEGYAFKPQSAASDFTLQSLIRLEPILRGKAAPVITVHDSIIFEVRRQYLEEVMHTVKTVMENTGVQDICPTPVDLKVGSRWGSLKAA